MKPYYQSPWMRVDLLENKGARRAQIVIAGFIGPDWRKEEKGQRQNTAEDLRAELKALAGLDVDNVDVRINSPGGSMAHGLAIHDILAESRAHVETTVEGMTASAATVIAQAGKVRRMSSNALFLAHLAQTGAWGNRHDVETAAADLKAVDARIAELYAKRSGKSVEAMLAVMDRQNGRGEWLSGEQARDAGFVDEVYEPRDMAAAVDPTAFVGLNLPPIPAEYVSTVARSAEQTPHGVDNQSGPDALAGRTATEPSDQTGAEPVKITAEQTKALQARFGATLALAAVTEDLDYVAALERGADLQAKAMAEREASIAALTAERDTLTAKVGELTAKLADPLKPSEPPATPPGAPPAVKPIPEAHAELVKAGKSPAEGWALLRAERPADYANHFSMAGK